MEKKEKSENMKQKSKGKKGIKILLVTLATIVLLILLILSGFFILRANGKKQVVNATKGATAAVDTGEATKEEMKEWPEGRIRYQGENYDYNKDIMTFLFMGIDSRDEKVQESEEAYQGGQADTIFLLVLNPHNKKMQMIALDRNTMADVDRYGEQDAYMDTVFTQICVQHGFGDGTVKSAERMEKAVSKVFNDLPFTGYCAINMSAISKINDLVGGVTLEVQQDIKEPGVNLKAGETKCLSGKEAYWYLRDRNVEEFGSAAARLQRQKQYMTAFVAQAKQAFKQDPSLPVTVFNTLADYMTTDVTLEEATYLASEAVQYSFDSDSMLSVPGETTKGDIYEEFYIDEAGLEQMMIDVFYERSEE